VTCLLRFESAFWWALTKSLSSPFQMECSRVITCASSAGCYPLVCESGFL
jgi:hypothetical protein